MKIVKETKHFRIYKHWFKYYVYYLNCIYEEYFEYTFDELEDAIDYVEFWENRWKEV